MVAVAWMGLEWIDPFTMADAIGATAFLNVVKHLECLENGLDKVGEVDDGTHGRQGGDTAYIMAPVRIGEGIGW